MSAIENDDKPELLLAGPMCGDIQPRHVKATSQPPQVTEPFGGFILLKNEADWDAFDDGSNFYLDKPKAYPCFVCKTTTAVYGDPDFMLLTKEEVAAMFSACLHAESYAKETS